MPPGDEGARAVHGIKYPAPFVGGKSGGLFAIFLAQNGVLRPVAFDDGADGALGAAVGFSDRVEGMRTGLVCHLDALAEKGTDHRARRIRQAVGEGDHFFVDDHAAFQNETISPPATISVPPSITGTVGRVRKAKKVMTCQTTNRVAM